MFFFIVLAPKVCPSQKDEESSRIVLSLRPFTFLHIFTYVIRFEHINVITLYKLNIIVIIDMK